MVGIEQSDNSVVQGGSPKLDTRELEVAAGVYPGSCLQKGTNANDVVACTAGAKAIGWAGYNETNALNRPATIDTIYVVDSLVGMVYGGGFSLRARLANGQNVEEGQALVPTAAGELTAAAALIIDTGSTAVTSVAADGAIITGDVGDNRLVAYAREAVDASGGAAAIVVDSLI